MLLHPSTDICLKELARDMRGFFNSLLGLVRSRLRATFAETSHAESLGWAEVPVHTDNAGQWRAEELQSRKTAARLPALSSRTIPIDP